MLVRAVQKNPKTIQAAAVSLGYLPKAYGNAILLKTLHLGHESHKSQSASDLNPPLGVLAFIIPKDAMQVPKEAT